MIQICITYFQYISKYHSNNIRHLHISTKAFLYLKCPECAFDTQEEINFEYHALENHPSSFVLFGKTLKEEKIDNR